MTAHYRIVIIIIMFLDITCFITIVYKVGRDY
jgi:hypothetical protein